MLNTNYKHIKKDGRYLSDAVPLPERTSKIISIEDLLKEKMEIEKYEENILCLQEIDTFFNQFRTILRYIRWGFLRGFINNTHTVTNAHEKPQGEISDEYEMYFKSTEIGLTVWFTGGPKEKLNVLVSAQNGNKGALIKSLNRFEDTAEYSAFWVRLNDPAEGKTFKLNLKDLKEQMLSNPDSPSTYAKHFVHHIKQQRVEHADEVEQLRKFSNMLKTGYVKKRPAHVSPVILKHKNTDVHSKCNISGFRLTSKQLAFELSVGKSSHTGDISANPFYRLTQSQMCINQETYFRLEKVEKVMLHADMNDFKKIMLRNTVSRQNLKSKL